MPVVKISTKLGKEAIGGLAPHGDQFYDEMSTRAFAIAELAVSDRTEPAPDVDKEPSVTLRFASLEVASESQALALRKAMQALKLARTAAGTFTEDDDVKVAAKTLRNLADDINATENARLRVALTDVDARLSAALMINDATSFELATEISGALEVIREVLATKAGGAE